MTKYRARQAMKRRGLLVKLARLALTEDADQIRAELRRIVGRRGMDAARQALKVNA